MLMQEMMDHRCILFDGEPVETGRNARQLAFEEIASMVVHEVRQPLAAIATNGQACLQWLKRDDLDRSKLEGILEQIIMLANIASETAERLKDTVAGDEPVFELVDIGLILREAIELVQFICDADDVDLIVPLQIDSFFLMGDRVQIRQVFLNLLVNAVEAVKHLPRNERAVRVDQSVADGKYSVKVSDTGTGIDQEIAHRIFESFFSTKSSGMGMGLSICRTIVKAHGGDLEASNGIKRGAQFTVTLPVQPGEANLLGIEA